MLFIKPYRIYIVNDSGEFYLLFQIVDYILHIFF